MKRTTECYVFLTFDENTSRSIIEGEVDSAIRKAGCSRGLAEPIYFVDERFKVGDEREARNFLFGIHSHDKLGAVKYYDEYGIVRWMAKAKFTPDGGCDDAE